MNAAQKLQRLKDAAKTKAPPQRSAIIRSPFPAFGLGPLEEPDEDDKEWDGLTDADFGWYENE